MANHVSLNGGYQRPDCSAHPFGIFTAPSVIWRLWTYGVLFNPENSSAGFISISHTAIHSSILRVAEHKYDKFQPLRTNLRKPPLTEPQSSEWPVLVIMLNQPHYNTGCFLPQGFTLHAEDYGICFYFQHQWETASLIFFSLIFFSVCDYEWSVKQKEDKKIHKLGLPCGHRNLVSVAWELTGNPSPIISLSCWRWAPCLVSAGYFQTCQHVNS